MTALFKKLLVHPREFLNELKSGQVPSSFALSVYGASAVLGALFYIFKPKGFPAESLMGDFEINSILFWPAAAVCGFLLTAITSFWIKVFLKFLEGKELNLKFKPVLLVALSSHVYYALLFIFLAISSAAQSEAFYKMSEIFFSLASLVFVISGIRAVSGSSVGKIFLCAFTASLTNAACLYGLYLTGLISSEMFKALLFS